MPVTIINVHIPCEAEKHNEFQLLTEFATAKDRTNVIILGDFNAHIETLDLTASDKLYIGSNLLHE